MKKLGIFILSAMQFITVFAADLNQTIGADDIDFEKCKVLVNGTNAPVSKNGILSALGLSDRDRGWLATNKRLEDGDKIEYLLVFKSDIAIGSMICRDVSEVSVPINSEDIDINKPGKWFILKFAQPKAGHLKSILMPNEFKTKAILFTQKCTRRNRFNALTFVRFFKDSIANITQYGVANANQEFTQYHKFSPPSNLFASNIPKGISRWQNIGLNGDETKITQPPISEFNPAFFIISWDDKQAIDGFYLQSNITDFKLFEFVGADNINPRVTSAKDWKRIRRYTTLNAFGQPTDNLGADIWDRIFKHDRSNEAFVKFDTPLKTRGIKILINYLGSETEQVVTISSLKVLSDIGNAKLDEIFLPKPEDHPPFAIKLDMPEDGIASFVVNDSKGKRISNIMARRKLEKGSQQVFWDLKDLTGQYVQPGEYTVVGMLSKRLKLEYKMTPYPNVETNNGGNSNTPWRNGHSGTGGWLADHAAPNSVAAGGNRLYFGDGCCESGEAMIGCDMNGRRLWGHGNFLAWTGPSFLTANNKEAFAILPQRDDSELIYTINNDDFSKELWLERKDTPERKLGVSGATCDDEKLYLSINANLDRFSNAVLQNNVDFENCVPKYKKKQKDDETIEDPRSEFARLFRIMGTPTGQGGRNAESNKGVMDKLESTSYPSKRQHVVLALKDAAPIGSLAFPFPDGDFNFSLSYLKDGQTPPFDPNDDSSWTEFYRGKGKGWTVLPLPEKTITKALRISFDKRDDLEMALDDASDLDNDGGLTVKDKASNGLFENKNWLATLDGMKILRRRFKDLNDGLKISVNSGSINKDGEWYAERTTPITDQEPGIYVMEWKTKQKISGLAIKEVDAKLTEIDYYTGPDTGPIDITSGENWKKIAEYEQKRRYYYQPDINNNKMAIYLDGYVDFEEEITTRAIRLRLVEQWVQKREGRAGLYGVRLDRGGLDMSSTRCRVYGVTAVQYIGGEIPVDPILYERFEVYDIASKKLQMEMYLPNAGQIIKSPDGRIFVISNNDVYALDLNTKKTTLFTDDPIKPLAIAADKDNNIYVYDGDDSCLNVQVYDSNGNKVRTIGKPGGHVVGKWNPEEIGFPNTHVAMAIDKNSHLWIVEQTKTPKRISEWTTDGKFLRDFLGNTEYGGGGCLDPYDKTKVYYPDVSNGKYGVMEFQLDWKTHKTKISKLLYYGNIRAGEYPIKVNGNLYLVSRPLFARQGYGTVCLYKGDRIVPVAAMGNASSFAEFNSSEILKSLGTKIPDDMLFHWSDLNGDEKPQVDEVVFTEKSKEQSRYSVSWFDHELGIQAGAGRYEVDKFLPNGVPVYKYIETPQFPNAPGMKTLDGNYIFWQGFSGNEKKAHVGYSKDGEKLWEYPVSGYGVHALSQTGPLVGEQVVTEFDIIGMVKSNNPKTGNFYMTNSNIGRWNLWTDDGILVGETILDRRDPEGFVWDMPNHEFDMDLTGINGGSEHFHGYFTKAADGKYYIVAGHNFIGIIEVIGIDDIVRTEMSVTITKEDILKTEEWNKNKKAIQVYEDAKVITSTKSDNTIIPDGIIGEWGEPVAIINDKQEFYMTFDDANLYVAYKVFGMGPFKNGGEDWRRLFKTGACVDLQIATDSEADKARQKGLVKGDVRLLMSTMKGQPIAVLYQPVAPDALETEEWETHTMVFSVAFDRVKIIKDVKIAYQDSQENSAYSVEAVIPLKSLGMTIKPGMSVKMDWGILKTSPNGSGVYERLYWSNKDTAILADEAAEAVIKPEMWGQVNFVMPGKTLLETSDAVDILESGGNDDISEDDILDELEGF